MYDSHARFDTQSDLEKELHVRYGESALDNIIQTKVIEFLSKSVKNTMTNSQLEVGSTARVLIENLLADLGCGNEYHGARVTGVAKEEGRSVMLIEQHELARMNTKEPTGSVGHDTIEQAEQGYSHKVERMCTSIVFGREKCGRRAILEGQR